MVISKKTINVNELKEWKNNKGFPILSFLGIYQASGLNDDISDFLTKQKEAGVEEAQVIAMQQIFCSFITLQKIRRIISDNWEHHNIDITADFTLEWKKDKSQELLPYSRTLSKRIQTAITQDFMNYGCGIDDSLPENVIIFTDGEDEDETTPEYETAETE